MSCGFTKVDLQNIVNIIEVCTKRGAFQAEEMTGVGQLYDKLKKGLTECMKSEESVKECVNGVCELSCDNSVKECPLNKDELQKTGT